MRPSTQPHDSVSLPFVDARRVLVSGLPSPQLGVQVSEADLDAEVEQLIRIGLYMVDRWAAQRAVPPGLAFERRLQEALDNCTYGHMRKIQADADGLLEAYLDRKRPVLDSEVVRQQLDALRTSINQDIVAALPRRKRHWRPAWVRWFMTELGAGPVAAAGVIFAALIVHFIAPRLETAAAHEFEEIFGAAPSTSSTSAKQ